MEFAVFKSGGKQYLVRPGDRLKVEKLPSGQLDKFFFDEVLLTANGDKIKFGTPFLSGAKVAAERLTDGRRRKLLVFKYKSKSRYRVKRGHRQSYTEVKITEIRR